VKFFSAKNEFLHEGYDQLQRQQRALDLKMTSVNRDKQTGTIKDYFVSLDKCTCVDFQKRHKPCKHIYRLAFELGIFDLDETRLNAQLSTTPKSVHAYFNPEIYFYAPIPKNFVVIDFETANDFRDSICQMGIAVVENNEVTTTKDFLIRPPYEKFTNTKIHGITFADVEKSPTFAELWSQIKIFIEGQIVAAYNMPFDLNCLVSVLKFYQIPVPDFSAFDVLENVRDCAENYDSELSYCINHRLVTVAEELGFAHDAHDALSDSVVAAQVQLWLSENFPDEDTAIHCTSLAAFFDGFAQEKFPLEVLLDFCKYNFKYGSRFSNKKHAEFFKLLEEVAARYENAALYKFCGKFYDEQENIPRAIELYRRAFELDSKSGVKTRIRTLEHTLKKNNRR